MILAFSFEVNPDREILERNIYTVLDLLSDIGGFTSIFISGISFLIAIWNFKNFEYHFLTNFFKKKATKTT